MIVDRGGKKFEKPDAGVFLGTIIDVVELGLVPSKNPKFPDPQVRLRIVWVLDKNDSEGHPYRIIEQPTAKLSDGGNNTKKSRLYEICEGVFQSAPPVPFNTEDLIGRSNALFLAKEGDYTNIKGFMPVPAGKTPPSAPAGFVRDKDDPKKIAARTANKNGGASAANTQSATPVQVAEEDIPF
jgi:hypothetical protein